MISLTDRVMSFDSHYSGDLDLCSSLHTSDLFQISNVDFNWHGSNLLRRGSTSLSNICTNSPSLSPSRQYIILSGYLPPFFSA
jgi:hypothetical protein